MGRRSYHRISYLWSTPGALLVHIVVFTILLLLCPNASGSEYSKGFYQPEHNSVVNTSKVAFEPRGNVGAGSSYSVAAIPGNSFSGSGDSYSMSRDGGGGYDMGGGAMAMGGYGAPAPMESPQMYKYQIYPSPPMQMGWGGEDEGGDGFGDIDFPKELIGLIGLKGLKGLKGTKGILGLLKLLLLLKKLLGIPLFPILLPLLLPLILLKLAFLILPLLLLLLIPIPVFVNGRKLLDSSTMGQSLKTFLQDKIESVMVNLPDDISHILEKIKSSGSDFTLKQLFSDYSSGTTVGVARGNSNSNKENKKLIGDTGSSRSKVVYVAVENAANIKPSSAKSKFSKKLDKNSSVKVATSKT